MERKFPVDLIPCPTCVGGANLAAEVVVQANGDKLAYCVGGGHVCTLVPAVEEHLRQIAAIAEKRLT